jgi:hypothetical protein
MAPWVVAGLLSPLLGLAVFAIVALATTMLYLFARDTVSRLGGRRIVAGYLTAVGVAIALTVLAHLVASFSLSEFVAALAFFGYTSSIALAIFVVPIVCGLLAKGRATAPWAIIASMLAGLAVAGVAFTLQRSTVPEGRELLLLVDMLYIVPFLAILGAAFAIGTGLPWRAHSHVS